MITLVKGTDREERDRIQEIGGYVTEQGRVMGDLAVARSLGDSVCQPFVSSRPFVRTIGLTAEDMFLIIACDGLWDVVSDQEAVQLVLEGVEKGEKDQSSVLLRDYAYMSGSTDNISVAVVHFQ